MIDAIETWLFTCKWPATQYVFGMPCWLGEIVLPMSLLIGFLSCSVLLGGYFSMSLHDITRRD